MDQFGFAGGASVRASRLVSRPTKLTHYPQFHLGYPFLNRSGLPGTCGLRQRGHEVAWSHP
ncbi:MAG: hypothetical protein DME26_12450 [Verrucomicrobia bacterium]|nr:MAG: hypothetical protein DME26_12450 [Verrucomicrobiota bacterium]